MTSLIFETYNNAVVTHGQNIQKTAPDMAIATMCPFPSAQHTLTHWKYVLRCCEKGSIIFIPIKN